VWAKSQIINKEVNKMKGKCKAAIILMLVLCAVFTSAFASSISGIGTGPHQYTLHGKITGLDKNADGSVTVKITRDGQTITRTFYGVDTDEYYRLFTAMRTGENVTIKYHFDIETQHLILDSVKILPNSNP
jgi:hypothetical protein